MTGPRPKFDQINIVCSDTDASLAFYRRLRRERFSDGMVWRTATGSASIGRAGDATMRRHRPRQRALRRATGTADGTGRADIAGRVVVGFGVATREEVDRLHAEHDGGRLSGPAVAVRRLLGRALRRDRRS